MTVSCPKLQPAVCPTVRQSGTFGNTNLTVTIINKRASRDRHRSIGKCGRMPRMATIGWGNENRTITIGGLHKNTTVKVAQRTALVGRGRLMAVPKDLASFLAAERRVSGCEVIPDLQTGSWSVSVTAGGKLVARNPHHILI